ncbi:hypothetical protein BU14_0066s0046 [Porphyra umbilicalis]|uniref:Uncharacterized protein n=1 Tax=Porphyra umbilicalis TaxID=2786 RepID=A0A1X6PH29_PORUM|nr:hypothetical protein BU14_0066s0046 [Porphyra umbilicalis]|eukprot:OSX79993.1 hypothetical protein BU14_0066s0046 [Porphyra umbilicalis]
MQQAHGKLEGKDSPGGGFHSGRVVVKGGRYESTSTVNHVESRAASKAEARLRPRQEVPLDRT